MRNLDQIRADNAWTASRRGPYEGAEGGQVVKKVPQYIRVNGFLNTLAYALERKDKGEGAYHRVFDEIAEHLAHKDIGLCGKDSAKGLLVELSEADSGLLRRVTAEAMAYLAYLRRFAEVSQ